MRTEGYYAYHGDHFKEYANAIGAAMEEADRAMDAMKANVTKLTRGGGGKKV